MPRHPRFDPPGSWHHVMHRGARRAPIFRRDEECLLFLDCLREAEEHQGLEIHAYALMPNHYHLLVRSAGNLSRSMRQVNATYTLRTNRRHGWDGPLFRGRFRSQLVASERYFNYVFAYIHLNPLQAGLAKRLDDRCWTSLRAYLRKERAPEWLRTDVFSERLGGPAGVAKVMRELRKNPEEWPAGLDLESGWISAEAEPPAKRLLREGRGPKKGKTIAQILGDVARVSGVEVSALKRAVRGPGANPARRLAVWALSRAQTHSHREIGAALGMSVGQVAKVLWRLRQPPPTEVQGWMAELADA